MTDFNGHTIFWDDLKYELLEHDPEERTKIYECRGTDEKYTRYIGTAEFCTDQLIDISDINIID